jgi:ectoine hydroxylase-related dioxygenase (phytanoyl-CoA dioxygenase family)
MSILEQPYPLSAQEITTYQRDGHILLSQALPREAVSTYRDAINATVEARNTETRDLADRDTYGMAFLQTMNLWLHNEVIKAFVMAKRFAGIAAALMGVERVRLYHDQALFKEPGGGFTPWHQDQHYWPLDTDNTITLWMPLTDVTADMGTLEFASGSHTEGYLGDLGISDESQKQFDQFVNERGFGRVRTEHMQAGDATFHSGWTLHAAGGNHTDQMRAAMTIIYFADGTRVGPLDNKNRVQDRDAWLPGTEPGDLAASELNPLL